MENSLKDKVVLVTGSSRGIGAACAKMLALSDAMIAVNYYRSGDLAEKVVREIESCGTKAMAIQADVRDRDAVDRMVDSIINKFGKIDILVNNANIHFPIKPFVKLSWESFESKISGEMKAVYNCSQAVLKDMLPRKSGKLIFISSTLSQSPGYGFSAHAAAKAALDSLARVMALELGPLGITVNTVGPGLTATDATAGMPDEMKKQVADNTPLRRIGYPDDVARVVQFLASPMADYLTGQYIPVCGGLYMP